MRWEAKNIPNVQANNGYKPDSRRKVSPEQAATIPARLAAGETQSEIATDIGVSQKQVSQIASQSAKRSPPAKNRSAKTISERAKAQQKEYLRGRRYRAEKKAEGAPTGNQNRKQRDQNDPVEPERTSEKLAKEHNISPATIKRDQLVPPDLSGRFRADFQKISQT